MRSCIHRGHKEKCLLKNKFTVTKNGKLSSKRIRSADSYGSRYGYLSRLKRAGLCSVARKKGVKIKSCKK
jgi:hypothetical protein